MRIEISYLTKPCSCAGTGGEGGEGKKLGKSSVDIAGCKQTDIRGQNQPLYLHQYATVVSALPSRSSRQTRDSTWPLQPSSPSPQEDESVMMSISVITALTSMKAVRVSLIVLT